jgi:hypothetical protein
MNDDPHSEARTATFQAHKGFRLLALITVIIGVLALAAAAFVFSYAGVHHMALSAGVPAGLARFYPALPDAVLVVACAAALALRGAKWWTRWLAWLSIILVAAAVGAAAAVYAMGIKVPRRPLEATIAVLPWVLLLLGFRLLLSVLRHPRREEAAAAPGAAREAVGDAVGEAAPDAVTSAEPAPATAGDEVAEQWDDDAAMVDAGSRDGDHAVAATEHEASLMGLDLVLGPRSGEPAADTGEDELLDEDGAAWVRYSHAAPGRHEAAEDVAEREAAEGAAGYEASEHAASAPPLSAPVPEQPQPSEAEAEPQEHDAAEPDAAEPGAAEPDAAEPDAAAPDAAAPASAHAQDRPPRTPPPDFHRVRSSPVRPGE